jgi:oxepin-CoA hydrolase/3-oxo-5,6-dehydrosuberyl-CoA semialdehyde dehydrogenase
MATKTPTLGSYLFGQWVTGSGAAQVLVNPATEAPLAQMQTAGLDLAGAVAYARSRGGPGLRELSFARRGVLLADVAGLLHTHREDLIALAIENGGNTRSDAKFDIDGAAATLAAYAELGKRLGEATMLADGASEALGRSPRFAGQHVLSPRHGVAVHINAFNFPAWGLAEKAAVAWLAGMPVLSKPASATALVAHHLVERIVEARILPDGALSLLCGGAGDLLDHLGGQDVLAFTGASETAARLRGLAAITRTGVRVNVEADSLNAAVLGPDVEPGSDTWQLFVHDVMRDMTQKAGQKCTAIRRVLVPAGRMAAAAAALAERLGEIVIGDPADSAVRMGPLATADQQRDVRAGIARLAAQTEEVFGGAGAVTPRGAAGGKGYFVGPVLRRTDAPATVAAMHEHEVFGPVATLGAYDESAATAAALVGRGAGGLVASVYSDDRAFLGALVPALLPYHGRIFLGSAKIAGHSPGPGTVLPLLVHGGPGRAGGGEELGGPRGLSFYLQRTALEGDQAILKALVADAAILHVRSEPRRGEGHG